MPRQFLKPKKGPAKKLTNIVTFDFEWNPKPGNSKFTVGSMYDGATVFRLNSPSEFLDRFLTAKYQGFFAYAHYGSGADFQWLFPYFSDWARKGYDVQIANAGGKILFVTIRLGKRVWYLRDSYKLIPLSLNRAALSFGLEPKLDTFRCQYCDGGFHGDERCASCFGSGKRWDLPGDVLWEYNSHDSVLLYRVLGKFSELASDIGFSVQRTTGACALDLFCRKYLKQPLVNYPKYSSLIHPAVFGGRVEIFRQYSERKVYAHDVNSMYPYVMKTGDFVSENPYRISETYLDNIGEGWQGVARCEVYCPDSTAVPVLPTKSHNGKLIFPVGRFSGTWSVYELKYAQSVGYEIGKLDYAIIGASKPIFKGYVEQLYGLRQTAKKEGDSARSEVLKLMLNSLYGKTLERGIYSKVLFDNDGDALEEIELNPPKNYLPLIGVDITARARVVLHKAMASLPSDSLLYCDTDSIYTETKLADDFLDPTELGLWDCEEYDSGSFILPKVYKVARGGEETVKAKGIKLWGKGDYEYLSGKALEYTTTATFKTKGYQPGHARKLVRRLRATYDKRVVIDDGRTTPIKLNNHESGGLGASRVNQIRNISAVKLPEKTKSLGWRVAWNPKEIHRKRWGLYSPTEKHPRSFCCREFTDFQGASDFSARLLEAFAVSRLPVECIHFSEK